VLHAIIGFVPIITPYRDCRSLSVCFFLDFSRRGFFGLRACACARQSALYPAADAGFPGNVRPAVMFWTDRARTTLNARARRWWLDERRSRRRRWRCARRTSWPPPRRYSCWWPRDMVETRVSSRIFSKPLFIIIEYCLIIWYKNIDKRYARKCWNDYRPGKYR